MKHRTLQLWQAFAMLNSAVVKQRVDASYPLYVVAAKQNGEQKPMCRLSFYKLTCLEMIEEAD